MCVVDVLVIVEQELFQRCKAADIPRNLRKSIREWKRKRQKSQDIDHPGKLSLTVVSWFAERSKVTRCERRKRPPHRMDS